MQHRTQAQASVERAPRLFPALPLLVPQGEVRRGEAIVVAMDHECSVETCFFPLLRRVTPQQASFGQAAITAVAAARPQLTPPLGRPCTPHLVEGRQFGCEFPQACLARGSRPCLFLGGVAHAIAPPTFPCAAADFLDPPLVRDALIAAGALEDRACHRIAAAQGPPQEIFPPTSAARGELLVRPHPRIPHNHPVAQGPPPEGGFDLGARGDIDSRARKDPVPHRHASARHRQPHNNVRGITPAVFRETALAGRLIRLGPRRGPACDDICLADAPVDRLDVNMPGGGIVEPQFHLAAEPVGEADIAGGRNGIRVGCEHIQRPGEMRQGQALGAVHAHLVTPPLVVTRELGTGRPGPVGHPGTERPFDRTVDCRGGELWRDHLGAAQSRPEGLKHGEGPKGPGSPQAPRRRLRDHRLRGTSRAETTGELTQARSALGILRPPTILETTDFGAFFGGGPHALGQLQRGDDGAIGSRLTGLTPLHGCHETQLSSVLSSLLP
jgi:hypothetical protein